MKKSLSILLLLVLAAPTFVSCGTSQKAPQKKELGLQFYSMRDTLFRSKGNYLPIMEQVASWGYTTLEAAGYDNGKFYGSTPEEFKANAEKAGLKLLSSHAGRGLSREELAAHDFTAAMEWWKTAIAAHKAAGMSYIVTAGIVVPETIADLQTYCDYFNEVGKMCAAEGIQYGYHNHSHEFRRVEGKVMYDYMIEHTDPKYVLFEMDVYWANMGGAAPVNYFKRYPGRFKLLHIKDECTLGESGMVGFDAIFNHADEAGLEHLIVEVECDPYPSVKESAAYLLNAPWVKASYAK